MKKHKPERVRNKTDFYWSTDILCAYVYKRLSAKPYVFVFAFC